MSAGSAASPPSSSPTSSFLSRVNSHLLSYEQSLQLDHNPLLNFLNAQTQQPRIYILLGIVFLLFTVVVHLFGLQFVSNLFAFVPLYESFKALKTERTDDDAFWLTYWVVFGFFSLFESSIDTLFFWLPAYYFLKIGFLIWCFHPKHKGAQVVYSTVVAPIFMGLQRETEEIKKSIKAARGGHQS